MIKQANETIIYEYFSLAQCVNIITYNCLPRTGHDSLRRREMRLARVSMCIVLLYMICHLPKLLPTLLELIYADPEVGWKV